MIFLFTARHFKAHDSIKEFAKSHVEGLTKYYDGITKAEVILSYEKPVGSIKTAEIIVHAKGNHIFTAKESSDDFKKSFEAAMNKIETQIKKFKDKLTDHNGAKKLKHLEVTELKDTELKDIE